MNKKKINIISIPVLIEKAKQNNNSNKYTTVQVNKKTAKLLKLLSNIQGVKTSDILNDLIDKEVLKLLKKEKRDLKNFQEGKKYIRDSHGNLSTLKDLENNRKNNFSINPI